MRDIDPRQEIIDAGLHQLGRNDAVVPPTPRLKPSEFFPGLMSVQPQSVDHGGTRTGRNERR
jgi:hypothetical protein